MDHFHHSMSKRARTSGALFAVVAAVVVLAAGCDEPNGQGFSPAPIQAVQPTPKQETLADQVTRSLREIGQEIREKRGRETKLKPHVEACLEGLRMHHKYGCPPGCTDCVKFDREKRDGEAELTTLGDALERLVPLEAGLRKMLMELPLSAKDAKPSDVEIRARQLLALWEAMKAADPKPLPVELILGKPGQGN